MLHRLRFRSVGDAPPPAPADPERPGGDLPSPLQDGLGRGLELAFPLDQPFQVSTVGGELRFETDLGAAPGHSVVWPPFGKLNDLYYGFNTHLDLRAAAGVCLRIEPPSRLFFDETGTVPIPVLAHLHTAWWPAIFFITFKAPPEGGRHVFLPGEPYARLVPVPEKASYTVQSPEAARPAAPAVEGEHRLSVSATAPAVAPSRIRLQSPGWSGDKVARIDGSASQPWHCTPVVEGACYGLELPYGLPNEVRITAEGAAAGVPSAFEDGPDGFYRFDTGLDLQLDPGWAVRMEPHPRFHTDRSGEVPLPVPAHFGADGRAFRLTVPFRRPLAGESHVFRRGEPYAQLIVVPEHETYAIEPMDGQEAAERELQSVRIQASDRVPLSRWTTGEGFAVDDIYRRLLVLSRKRAKNGTGSPASET